MPKNDRAPPDAVPKSDQPPADTLPWAEAFERFIDPTLLEALRRSKAACANVPPREYHGKSWIDGEPAYSTMHPQWAEYRRALNAAEADFRRRLLDGELRAWGREGEPSGPRRTIPADAWSMLVVASHDQGVLRGPKPRQTRFYNAVVARQAIPAKSPRGRNPIDDNVLLAEMRALLPANPTPAQICDAKAKVTERIDDPTNRRNARRRLDRKYRH